MKTLQYYRRGAPGRLTAAARSAPSARRRADRSSEPARAGAAAQGSLLSIAAGGAGGAARGPPHSARRPARWRRALVGAHPRRGRQRTASSSSPLRLLPDQLQPLHARRPHGPPGGGWSRLYRSNTTMRFPLSLLNDYLT